MISLIAVISKNLALGYKNKLLWQLPTDMIRFKKITSNHVVVMGRKTFESLVKPLVNRFNLVISRDQEFIKKINGQKLSNLIAVDSLEKALKIGGSQKVQKLYPGEIFIIGGARVYQQAINLADRLYLTVVDQLVNQADAFFPDYSQFKKIIFKKEVVDNGLKTKFMILSRR